MEKEKLKPFTFDVKKLFKDYNKIMKKNYKAYNSEEVECPNCGWNTLKLVAEAKNKKDALERLLKGGGVCEECYINKAYRPIVFHL